MKNNKQLVNIETGEIIDLEKSSPKEITQALSLLIVKRKELQAIEDKVKRYIKEKNLNYEENSNGILEAEFGLARVRKSYREGFNQKKFEEKATDKEKLIVETATKIKQKYSKLTEVITIF